MRTPRLILTVVLVMLSSSCSSLSPLDTREQSHSPGSSAVDTGQEVDDAARRLIASDFISALRQVRSLPPRSTTVQLLRDDRADGFTRTVAEVLQSTGYGIRWVQDSASDVLFQYRHEREFVTVDVQRVLYEVAVGRVELRRSYVLGGQGSVQPVTPLYIRGTDASHIVLNEAAFRDDTEMAGNDRVDEASPDPRMAGTPIVRSAELAIADEANPLGQLVSGATRANSLTLPLVNLPRVENVFELGTSNFQKLLDRHRVVKEQVLTFPNDSLRLGDVNKRIIEQLVESFDADKDVFSVIGCSIGPTTLKSGNAALALGRASRVREALVFAGVPQDRIFDEGCWAGNGKDILLPRRGVVVTLNRRLQPG